jgi:hypothetical protein
MPPRPAVAGFGEESKGLTEILRDAQLMLVQVAEKSASGWTAFVASLREQRDGLVIVLTENQRIPI